jgi:hypothetical protein
MGGSGGGGRGLRRDELKKLEEIARETLRRGAQPEKRSVFISFASEDLDEVNLLRGQAKNEQTDLEFVDRSLKAPFESDNAEYIRRGIRERIKQASVTIVYLTDSSATSKWVDWEIRESARQGKGVIAMYAGEGPPRKLPWAITELGIKPVPWTHRELSSAIEKAAKKRVHEE